VTSLESFTGGRQLAVDTTAIERELACLWKAASGVGGGSSPAIIRACQLNLIVACASAEETGRAASAVAEVIRLHPSRVLMAVVDAADRSNRLQASISAHCALAAGAERGSHVCCEQITLTASSSAIPRLAAAVLPLLVPDLPVVLWWPGDPDLEADLAADLTDAADRVVVDSRRFSNPASSMRRLSVQDCPVSDLAWHRLRGWRELTAGFFDGEAAETYPPRLEKVLVEYAGAGREISEAALLGSWVASCLKWGDRPGPVGKIALQARSESDQAPGSVLSLTLEAPGASFSLRREGGAEFVASSMTIDRGASISRLARVACRDEATLLSRSLDAGGRDTVYEEAVDRAVRMLDQGGDEGAKR